MAVTRAAGVIKMTAGSDAVTGRVIIHSIRWVKPGTDGDDILLSDTAGNEIWAEAAIQYVGASMIFPAGFVANGLKLTTLDSGTLYIYLQ